MLPLEMAAERWQSQMGPDRRTGSHLVGLAWTTLDRLHGQRAVGYKEWGRLTAMLAALEWSPSKEVVALLRPDGEWILTPEDLERAETPVEAGQMVIEALSLAVRARTGE